MLRGEALGDLDEDLVAGGVAEGVVDRLEVVEVEEDDREPAAVATGAGDGVADALAEQRAVGEAGDGVVEGLVGELVLEGLALGDVAAVEHDAADVLVVQQVRVEDLELARLPSRWRSEALEDLGLGSPASDAVGEQVQQPAVLARVEQRGRSGVPMTSSGV